MHTCMSDMHNFIGDGRPIGGDGHKVTRYGQGCSIRQVSILDNELDVPTLRPMCSHPSRMQGETVDALLYRVCSFLTFEVDWPKWWCLIAGALRMAEGGRKRARGLGGN
ncbi:conserved hypothetical protein [Ricinus communis]|uniref:Uncharacterized protein n=1 Tax=Ricinus communis TaxID=3988 RepID=B9S3H8_RICCO|nr:conserved hypothetical protein [Ricinus communis]